MSQLEILVPPLRARGAAGQSELDHVLRCVYRCLLYLGDLARYREIYSERDPKDFGEAERYYERAALIVPHAGNAQNQVRRECVEWLWG